MNAFYGNQNDVIKIMANLIRMHATETVNIQVKESDRLKPEELWKFPWEEDNAYKWVTIEKAQAQYDFLKRAMDQIEKQSTNG